jgi:hypothetical protein
MSPAGSISTKPPRGEIHLKRIVSLLVACALVGFVACDREKAKDAANRSPAEATNSASDALNAAKDVAKDAAQDMADTGKGTAAASAGNAVDACRALAETGSWSEALEVCREAHDTMPDDLALDHAYQQAQAAAGH